MNSSTILARGFLLASLVFVSSLIRAQGAELTVTGEVKTPLKLTIVFWSW